MRVRAAPVQVCELLLCKCVLCCASVTCANGKVFLNSVLILYKQCRSFDFHV